MRVICAVLASVALVLVVLYPNLYLGAVQASNEIAGLESLIDPDDELVMLVGEHLRITGETPESWVQRNIEWVSDYDLYLNLEYWATPAETILAGKGDCEDRAIVSSSINRYLEREATVVTQLDHVYVVVDGKPYFGVSETRSTKELVAKLVEQVPLARKVAIAAGLLLIWAHAVFRRPT